MNNKDTHRASVGEVAASRTRPANVAGERRAVRRKGRGSGDVVELVDDGEQNVLGVVLAPFRGTHADYFLLDDELGRV